jgi:hypothetical protein
LDSYPPHQIKIIHPAIPSEVGRGLRLVGTDQFNFKDCGATLPAGSTCYDEKPMLRSYTSFTQAADENAISRVYVGFHFCKATVEGTAYGRKIGERAATLLPAAK